jgi:DNA adenine methylase
MNNIVIDSRKTIPFLKWAGGKRWLVDQHKDLINVKFDRFVEPFLGSGAVFFQLKPYKSILSDKNESLINTYIVMRDDWKNLLEHLEHHQKCHSKEYYYKTRGKTYDSKVERAAQFIYLNRTCWNGLYRVNLKGKFNVPIGTKNNVLLESDNFEEISNLLKNAKISSSDFEEILDQTSSGDFVFVDPPYTVKHNNNGFIKYNENLFSWDDQVRLRNSVERSIDRGAKVLVTNASHESIRNLYEGLGKTITLSRKSVISGKSSGRGKYEETIIKCF